MRKALAFINPRLSTRNVGDIFIEDSTKRILAYDPAASIDVDPRKPITQGHIDEINHREAAVILGTNLYYREMFKPGRWMFRLEDLKEISVPIIPLGVGTTRHTGEDNGFDADTLEQLKAIHSSCAMGSARDPRTLEALVEAGISNVSMTGCLTLFRSLKSCWSLNDLSRSRRVVVTVRKGQSKNVRRLASLLAARGLEVTVAAQQDKDLFLRRGIPLIRKPFPTVYEYDIRPYLKLVEESLGAIGWRLHGNMLHLAHGNAAMFFANCSRAESFCRYFDLPCAYSEDKEDLPEAVTAEMVERFLDPATFSAFPDRYARTYDALVEFLDANGLAHNLHRRGESEEGRAQGT